jgi:hypothetical protein
MRFDAYVCVIFRANTGYVGEKKEAVVYLP